MQEFSEIGGENCSRLMRFAEKVTFFLDNFVCSFKIDKSQFTIRLKTNSHNIENKMVGW